MTTLADFRNNVRSLGSLSPDDTRLTDVVINREINRALRRIAMARDWPWLQVERPIALVASKAKYSLPDDFLRIVSLRHKDTGDPLNLRTQMELDGYGTGPGRPTAYSVWANNIRLARTPADSDDGLILKYICQENILNVDTDAPLIPVYWEDGVYEAVLVQLHRMIKQLDEATLAEQRFQVWIAETQDNITQNKAAPRVRARKGSWI